MTTIERIDAAAYRFPTPVPEADGTLEWQATTAVTVTLQAGGVTGLGWTYSSPATPALIEKVMAEVVCGRDVLDHPRIWEDLRRRCRNLGNRDLVMQAVSAIDVALWDLRARLLDVPVATLLGRFRPSVPVYGSGGFTTLDESELAEQVDWWRSAGCRLMKIKIAESWGGDVERDLKRVRELRSLAGEGVDLMVDANGGYSLGQARRVGDRLDELGVIWFEEPVSSRDLDGLGQLRTALRCDVAAGEYASDVGDARLLLPVVDCLQLDVTRCGGYTGFLRGAAVAKAHEREVSVHCAPSISAPVAAATPNLRHLEWFVDHARLEPILVDGAPEVRDGKLQVPDDVVGHGMTLSERAEQYRS